MIFEQIIIDFGAFSNCNAQHQDKTYKLLPLILSNNTKSNKKKEIKKERKGNRKQTKMRTQFRLGSPQIRIFDRDKQNANENEKMLK